MLGLHHSHHKRVLGYRAFLAPKSHLGLSSANINALSYPRRLPLSLPGLNLAECSNLEFHDPDYDRFPALSLAFTAIRKGGVLPAVLNAANEIAVDAFLDEKIPFLEIATTVATVMEQVQDGSEDEIDDILAADRQARDAATALINAKF